MKTIRALLVLLCLPAFADNARTISRVSDMLEGSEVDPIVWYQGESVTIDVYAKRGNERVQWPATASSVLRVWVDGTPGTLYVQVTNSVYAASVGQTRNTLTPAQSNLATNDYKFSVAVYDSTTFMGIAAEGDLEVRYAPQTGLALVSPTALWPTNLVDLADVEFGDYEAGAVLEYNGTNWTAGVDADTLGGLTPTAGRIIYGTGSAWATLAAGTTGQVLTAQGAAAPIWSSAGAGDITAVSVTGGLLTGGGTTGAVSVGLTTNAVQTAVSGLYLPLTGTSGHTIGWTTDGLLLNGGAQPIAQIGVWRGGNGQASMGVLTNETPVIWMESDEGFAFQTFRTSETLWITSTETGTSLVKLRASLSAADLLTGTIPDGRFPATLPAASGANLTNLDASDLASGTVPDAVIAAKYKQPVIAWTYRDLTLQTTAGVGWTGYEITAGSRRFGLDAISAAAADDQLATLRTDWVPVPATFAAFKTTGAVKLTWVVNSAAGVTEIRGIRLTGKSALTGTETILYTDTTTRDVVSSGVPVEVTINRSAFSSTVIPAYIAADVDFSVEDGEKAAVVAIEVLSE